MGNIVENPQDTDVCVRCKHARDLHKPWEPIRPWRPMPDTYCTIKGCVCRPWPLFVRAFYTPTKEDRIK